MEILKRLFYETPIYMYIYTYIHTYLFKYTVGCINIESVDFYDFFNVFLKFKANKKVNNLNCFKFY